MKTLLAAVTAAAISVPLTPAPAQAAQPGCWERAPLCHALTAVRGSELDQSAALQRQARDWAHVMADAGAIFHADPRFTTTQFYGENVGYGPDWLTVFAAFEQSPPHLANMRDTDFTQVGFGRARVDGRVYVVIRFR